MQADAYGPGVRKIPEPPALIKTIPSLVINYLTDIYKNDKVIYMKDEVTAFQLGSSIVVTLPKKLGIKPGQKLKVEQTGREIILKKEKMTKEEIAKMVRKLAGGLRLKPDLTPEEINEELDRRYEEMLPGH